MAYLLEGSGGKYIRRYSSIYIFCYYALHIHTVFLQYLSDSCTLIFYIKGIQHLDGHHSKKLSEYTVVAVSK